MLPFGQLPVRINLDFPETTNGQKAFMRFYWIESGPWKPYPRGIHFDQLRSVTGVFAFNVEDTLREAQAIPGETDLASSEMGNAPKLQT